MNRKYIRSVKSRIWSDFLHLEYTEKDGTSPHVSWELRKTVENALLPRQSILKQAFEGQLVAQNDGNEVEMKRK